MNVRKLERRGAVRWVADLGLVAGRRMSRTFQTQDEANGWLERKRQERRRLGDEALTLPDAKRLSYANAERRLAGIATIDEAVEFYLKHRNAVTPRTVLAAIGDRVEDMRLQQLRQVSINGARRDLTLWFKGREETLVSELALSDLQQIIVRGKPAQSTQRSRVVAIKAFMTFCASRHYVLEDIGKQLRRPELDSGPPKILAVEEARRLFRKAKQLDPDMAASLALVAFGGVRPMEAMRLTASCVVGKYLDLNPDRTKTRQRRLVEINPTLKAWLKAGKPWGLTNYHNRRYAIAAAAGIPWTQDVLRHSFGSYAYAAFGGKWTSQQMGNTEDVLHKHYRERVTKEQAKRYWAIRP